MAAIPYMPLYVADYLADAGHLTTLQHGAYLLLLMNYWQRGKGLPATDAALMSITRLSRKEWEQNSEVLMEFFTEADGLWIHKRVEFELLTFRNKSAQSAEAARVRWDKRNAEAMRTHSERSTNAVRTECHTDTDTEESKTPISPLPEKRQRQQKVLFDLIEAPADWIAYAVSYGWDASRINREFGKLRDWAFKEKAKRPGWLKTWQSWVDRSEERFPTSKTELLPLTFKPRPSIFSKTPEELEAELEAEVQKIYARH